MYQEGFIIYSRVIKLSLYGRMQNSIGEKKSLLYEHYLGTYERYISIIKLISSLELQAAGTLSFLLPYLRLA